MNSEFFHLTQVVQLRDDFATLIDMFGIRGTIEEWMDKPVPQAIAANKRILPYYASIIRKYKENILAIEKVKFNG